MPVRAVPAKKAEKADFSLSTKVDGRLEVLCRHGIGHTVSVPKGMEDSGEHNCDGCCSTEDFKRYVKALGIRRIS